jgi:ATP-dependent Zn protease
LGQSQQVVSHRTATITVSSTKAETIAPPNTAARITAGNSASESRGRDAYWASDLDPLQRKDLVTSAGALEREIDLAIRDIVARGGARAEAILTQRRRDLDDGVQLLLAQETITAEAFAPLRPATAAAGQAGAPAPDRAKPRSAAKAIAGN